VYPKLTKVIGKCPPEDVGGAPGYDAFLEAMADTKHPEHKSIKEWYGDIFDPNEPNKEKFKLDVLKLAK
jgi:Plasmid pRiA4b ORF-3-like protein